jgi:hypothetical protein
VNQRSTVKSFLQDLTAIEFEKLVADLWTEMGWSCALTQGSRDQGIDVIASKSGVISEKVAIQAKGYDKGNKVGRPSVQQYNTIQQQYNEVDNVIIVTSSSFTDGADQLARQLGVKTVNGSELAEACLSHFPERYFFDSENTQTSEKEKPEDSGGNNGRSHSEETLNETGEHLASIYEVLLKRGSEVTHRRRWSLSFDMGDKDENVRQYYVSMNGTHSIEFYKKSEERLNHIYKMVDHHDLKAYVTAYIKPDHAEKYEMSMSVGDDDIKREVPFDEGEIYDISIEMPDTDSPSHRKQARLSASIFDHVCEQDLSGTVVSGAAPGLSEGSFEREVK